MLISGANLLRAGASDAGMDVGSVMLMFAVGTLVSLPFTLVAPCVLFDGDGFTRSFAVSVRAFTRNAPAFLLYGALSYALLVIGIATFALGLVIVLPLWATSSYAAWRELTAHAPDTQDQPRPNVT